MPIRNTCLTFVLTLATVLGACSRKPSTKRPPDSEWWRTAVVYEICPRSFADTDGDGIGDLNGITLHLDYLKYLGVDAVLITPFYPSPQVDFGYDIADFENIDPQYGTFDDFGRLVEEARKRDIRVIADLVLNHTSNQHPWFRESRSSRTNPKADWYIWHDAKDKARPTNRRSASGHSAWQWEPSRSQFYSHTFYREQPDLNWRNREVRNAMYNIMRFWMKRGVEGFRLGAIRQVFEDPTLRDEPITKPGAHAHSGPIPTRTQTWNLPEPPDVLRELGEVINEFPGRVLVGETYLPGAAEQALTHGERSDELHLSMHMQFALPDRLSADGFRARLRGVESRPNDSVSLFLLDDHDRVRSWSRYGDGKNDLAIAKLLATVLMASRDSALIYYGQEIGVENIDSVGDEVVRDPIGKSGWPEERGRDGQRTPMQWNSRPSAGFSTADTTWLPVAPSYKDRNVAAQTNDSGSLLNYYRTLIRLRKEHAALREGDFALVNETDTNVLSWVRNTKDGEVVVVALNFTANTQGVSFNLGPLGLRSRHATALLSALGTTGSAVALDKVTLPAYSAFMGAVR